MNTNTQRGDWKPLVFIMTDGCPTDNWKEGLKKLHEIDAGVIVACAAGKDSDISVLKQVTENVVQLDCSDESHISSYFEWISSSIQSTSTKIGASPKFCEGEYELPPPPKKINLVKS